MSRIYDALQRADRERKAAEGSESRTIAEPASITAIEEPPPDRPEFEIDRISLQPWKPKMVSLPTLGDRGAGIEQFRTLRSHVYQLRDQAPLKTILVSSGMPAEGKSFITANLAVSLARNKNVDILLIDADLRRSSLHTMLGTNNTPGLSEYLGGTAELSAIMQRDRNPEADEASGKHGIANLTFIPAGSGGDSSSELVTNPRLEQLIATVSPHFDWILIDSAPVLAVADTVDIARVVDGVLLVARGASTPYDVAQRTQAAFRNSRVLGFVLNAVKDAPRNGYYYYYGK
jgi:capsular exopolysaccharide synthesis family protein